MNVIKGIRQLQATRGIFEQLVFEISHGDAPTQDDIPNRIATIQSALENSKKYFLEANNEHRKPLSERLPQLAFARIHRDIGQASMCWEHPEKAGVFDAEKAADIARELCLFVADLLEESQDEGDSG